ncbi:MAG: hypothetical protein BWK79_02885 [Beggiatoa sp. IS2]|nr:MAG: hypothetical protein BWK79_02885 [Beggiatoa sp. IS2]
MTLTSIYPAVLFLFTSVVILVLLIFSVPIVADLFKSFGAELPTPTRVVVQLSDFLVKYLWWVLATLFIFAGYLEFLRRNGQLILKTPFFSKLFHKAMIIRFLRGYALLYSPIVSPAKTLEECIQLMGNAFYANRLRQMGEQLNAGKSFPEVLAQFPHFHKKIRHIAIVGLKTQKLDKLFNKIAARYTQQLQGAIEPTVRMFFVATTVFLGMLIGFLVIAMYMPIFKMCSII